MRAVAPPLCAVAAAFCLAWSAPGAASPYAPSPSPVGQQGYSRFHANDSLIGQIVPCTHHEKLCFRFNLLYSQSDHRCTEIDYNNVGDRDKLLKGSGHLTAITLKDEDPCLSNGGYRMAYDNNCYLQEIVSNIICGCSAQPTHYFLGGLECRCTPPSPNNVGQPEVEGQCLIPDLRFPDVERAHFFQNPFEDIQGFKTNAFLFSSRSLPRLACSLEQAQCFSEGKVWVPEVQACVPLLERGPCPEEHVVTLVARAAREGRAETTCVHVRGGCPQGHVRTAFDGRCYNEDDLHVVVPGKIYRNQYGIHVATPRHVVSLKFQPMREKGNSFDAPDLCVVRVNATEVFAGNGASGAIPCTSGSGCSRYQVLTSPPKPQF